MPPQIRHVGDDLPCRRIGVSPQIFTADTLSAIDRHLRRATLSQVLFVLNTFPGSDLFIKCVKISKPLAIAFSSFTFAFQADDLCALPTITKITLYYYIRSHSFTILAVTLRQQVISNCIIVCKTKFTLKIICSGLFIALL